MTVVQHIVPLRVTFSPLSVNMIGMGANTGSNGVNPAIHFGHQVRKQRKAHGWSIHELAKRCGITVGYLSMIENGKRPPNERTAAKIDAVFSERDGWFGEYHRDSQNWTLPGYRHWSEHEDRAREIWAWVPGVIHGLVQTEKYARVLIKALPGVPGEVAEARVKGRMDRQKRILYRDRPPAVVILVDVMALLRLVGSPEIMALQLAHVLEIASLPHVTMHVVPAEAHGVVSSLLEVTESASYAEHLVSGGVYIEDETVAHHERIVRELQANAYRANESVQIIERVKATWESGESPLTAILQADHASK